MKRKIILAVSTFLLSTFASAHSFTGEIELKLKAYVGHSGRLLQSIGGREYGEDICQVEYEKGRLSLNGIAALFPASLYVDEINHRIMEDVYTSPKRTVSGLGNPCGNMGPTVRFYEKLILEPHSIEIIRSYRCAFSLSRRAILSAKCLFTD